MPQLSWNETRDRAIASSREWKDASHGEQQKHLFWIGFFECFGVPLKSVACSRGEGLGASPSPPVATGSVLDV